MDLRDRIFTNYPGRPKLARLLFMTSSVLALSDNLVRTNRRNRKLTNCSAISRLRDSISPASTSPPKKPGIQSPLRVVNFRQEGDAIHMPGRAAGRGQRYQQGRQIHSDTGLRQSHFTVDATPYAPVTGPDHDGSHSNAMACAGPPGAEARTGTTTTPRLSPSTLVR